MFRWAIPASVTRVTFCNFLTLKFNILFTILEGARASTGLCVDVGSGVMI